MCGCVNVNNENREYKPTVSCSILMPRRAALEAETLVLRRRNDRFQEKLLLRSTMTNPCQFSCSILRPRRAAVEAETVVLCRRNDRFQEKLLFSLRKITFLMPKGLRKPPLGDPSDE